jgi:hypothetical protein
MVCVLWKIKPNFSSLLQTSSIFRSSVLKTLRIYLNRAFFAFIYISRFPSLRITDKLAGGNIKIRFGRFFCWVVFKLWFYFYFRPIEFIFSRLNRAVFSRELVHHYHPAFSAKEEFYTQGDSGSSQ